MSKIVIVKRGSYKFKAKQCKYCNKFRALDKFRYIQYLDVYRKICIQCEGKIKKEKIKFKKKHGVPLRIYRDAEARARIESHKKAEHLIFSKISDEEKEQFNFSNKIKDTINGINGILVFTFLFFIFTPLIGLLSELPSIKVIGFSTVFLIIINKVKSFYIKKYWFPINKKILDQKEFLYPNIFKQVLKDTKEEFQKNENFYSSPEWRELREQVLNFQPHICYICDKFIDHDFDLTVDHVKPKSKYPDLSLELSNLKIACRSCNSAKGNKDKSF